METNAVTIVSMMRRKAFRLGFEDKRKARWRGDDLAILDRNGAALTYERGRLFATSLPEVEWSDIMTGQTVRREAIRAYMKLQSEKVLI